MDLTIPIGARPTLAFPLLPVVCPQPTLAGPLPWVPIPSWRGVISGAAKWSSNKAVEEEQVAEGPWGKWALLVPHHSLLASSLLRLWKVLSAGALSWTPGFPTSEFVPLSVKQWMHSSQSSDY